MTHQRENGSPEPLSTVLSLLTPRRVILAGPGSGLLQAAVGWASQTTGVELVRRRDAAEVRDGDIIVCEDAGLLPGEMAAAVLALIPLTEMSLAASRGWKQLVQAGDGAAVVARRSVAPQLELRLEHYARARLVMSQALAGLGARSLFDRPPPPRADLAPVRVSSVAASAGPGRSSLTVIIPVYNAAAELRRCIWSVSRHTTWPCELLIVDDASPEPAIADVLELAARLTGARILRNVVNLGFTATVNRALRATSGDVVLLNSDTQVGPRWLEHLVQAAYSSPAVATVTPVSDNAGAFSVPRIGEANLVPATLAMADVARLIAQHAAPRVAVPTGSGFCMYIKRETLDAIGEFDASTFARGYGEENDLCMRALAAGWTHLIDGRTFVHHVREASFGQEKAQLAQTARKRLDARYPEYGALVRQMVASDGMVEIRERVQAAYRQPTTPRQRMMSIIHEGGGGTWIANLELMRALETEWDPFVFTSDRRTLRLWRCEDGRLRQLEQWTLERSIRAMDFSREDYRAVVRGILDENEIELVHVRHLIKHSFDAPRVASTLGIPVVFSFHDFYFACPTVNLLDDHDNYCGAQCTPGDGQCRVPKAGLDGLPHLKHRFVYQWREEVEAMLRDVDAFVTTSDHAREVHLRALRSLSGRPFELIEHGRHLRQRAGVAVPPQPGGPIRILVVANLDVHKGGEYLRGLRAADHARRLEVHLLGNVPERYSDLGVVHGSFVEGELPARAAALAPAFIGCLSIVPETYSHSLTEAWAMGVPAIATDIGAFGERIRAHGGGALIPLGDPVEAIRRIYSLADDPAAYAKLQAQATLRGCSTVKDMTDSFATLYRRVLDDRRSLVVPAEAEPVSLRHGVVELVAVVPGGDGVHPGSTYVRVLRRYTHPSVSSKLSLRVRLGNEELPSSGDLVLVQRTALHPDTTDEFLEELERRGLPLVLELDDHLLLRGETDPDYGIHRRSLTSLMEAARLVLVSNERLAEAVAGWARAVAVVPNLIDERLFLSGIDTRPGAAVGRKRPIQLVYIGSPTHASDLALIRPVIDQLEASRPGQFALNVVGVEPAGAGQDWYRRVTVPDHCKPYPEFVRWLRRQRPGWDIALAPLVDDDFNGYKTDLKFLEYAALGLPGVFSDRAVYGTVQDGLTGLRVSDSTEDWLEAVMALADDLRFRDAVADHAFEYLTSSRLLRHGAEDLLRLLCAVAPPSSTQQSRPQAAAVTPT